MGLILIYALNVDDGLYETNSFVSSCSEVKFITSTVAKVLM